MGVTLDVVCDSSSHATHTESDIKELVIMSLITYRKHSKTCRSGENMAPLAWGMRWEGGRGAGAPVSQSFIFDIYECVTNSIFGWTLLPPFSVLVWAVFLLRYNLLD